VVARANRDDRAGRRRLGENAAASRCRAAPERCDERPVGAAHLDVVDAVSPLAEALLGDGHELVTLASRREELDRAAGRDRDDVVRVARECEGGVCEREDQAPWQLPWPLSMSARTLIRRRA
jgi:hypothetical protein